MPIRRCIALLALLLAASCATSEPIEGAGEVNVFAAASLADAFSEIEAAFEGQAPGIDVRLNIAGSSTLREQILAGAPADVFVSANLAVMDELVAAGAANQPQNFVQNLLVIGVPKGNPGGITSLDDFGNADLLLGACSAGVPCGDAAQQLFDNASLVAQLDTAEPDVRALVTKLAAGELDAGIVYRTDTIANPDLDAVELPSDSNITVTYPIAPLNETANREAALAFMNFVFGEEAQTILKQNGFLPVASAG